MQNHQLAMGKEIDAHMIQTLFPDRAIKAQSFIDLLAANRKNENQYPLRVFNPLQNKPQDVELAVKELVKQLADRSINLCITKLNLNGDPFIY